MKLWGKKAVAQAHLWLSWFLLGSYLCICPHLDFFPSVFISEYTSRFSPVFLFVFWLIQVLLSVAVGSPYLCLIFLFSLQSIVILLLIQPGCWWPWLKSLRILNLVDGLALTSFHLHEALFGSTVWNFFLATHSHSPFFLAIAQSLDSYFFSRDTWVPITCQGLRT